MSELKPLMCAHEPNIRPMYDKFEADKVIAEQDKEIAELKEQVHDYALGLYVMQARAEKRSTAPEVQAVLGDGDVVQRKMARS